MTTEIKFVAGTLHNTRRTETGPYMDLEVAIDGKYAGEFTGYVNERVSKLIDAAPELLESLKTLSREIYNRHLGRVPEEIANALAAADQAISKATA